MTQKGQSNNNSNKIKDFAIEDLWIALNPKTEKLARILDEGMEAEDKDGNPDWNARYKFIRLVMEYAYGRPAQNQNINIGGEEFRQIIVGDLKGNDEGSEV